MSGEAYGTNVTGGGGQAYTGGGNGTFARVFKPEAYGAIGNGTSDDSTAVLAAITAAYNAGGGTVVFDAKTYRIDSQLALPNDAHSTIPRQPPIRLTGVGPLGDGSWQTQGTIPGGTVLDLRSTTGPAKIDTRGLGILEIDNLTLTQTGSAADTNPFLQTTNTTVTISDVAVLGHSSLSGTTCVQDAFVFGGTTTTLGGGSTAAFQGYGSSVQRCNFARIRRGAYLQAYANSIRITENTWSKTCGASSNEAAVHIVGTSSVGQSGTANVVTNNLFEVTNYPYTVRVTDAQKNYCVGNQFWDSSATTLACFYIEGASAANVQHNRFGSAFPGITPAKHLITAVAGASYLLERDSDGAWVNSGISFADLNGNALLEVKQTGEVATGTSASSVAFMSVQNGTDKVSIDATSVIKNQNNLDLYAGAAGTQVRVRRGLLAADSGMNLMFAATHFSGSGAPTIAGTAGDWYWRTGTPTVANQRAYICTVTGGAGVATWVGVV